MAGIFQRVFEKLPADHSLSLCTINFYYTWQLLLYLPTPRREQEPLVTRQAAEFPRDEHSGWYTSRGNALSGSGTRVWPGIRAFGGVAGLAAAVRQSRAGFRDDRPSLVGISSRTITTAAAHPASPVDRRTDRIASIGTATRVVGGTAGLTDRWAARNTRTALGCRDTVLRHHRLRGGSRHDRSGNRRLDKLGLHLRLRLDKLLRRGRLAIDNRGRCRHRASRAANRSSPEAIAKPLAAAASGATGEAREHQGQHDEGNQLFHDNSWPARETDASAPVPD